MFLREKKVGDASYVQLVESKRTSDGPRSKVVASFGRKDLLRESGKLDQLAAGFARLSSNGSYICEGTKTGVSQVCLFELKRLILEKTLRTSALGKRCTKLLGIDDKSLPELAHLFASLAFWRTHGVARIDFGTLPRLDNLPEQVASVLTAGNTEDTSLVVHIQRENAQAGNMSLLRGTLAATAVNSRGDVLMTMFWQEHRPLIEMIRENVERILFAMPGRRLVVSLDAELVRPDRVMLRKQLISSFHASDVYFVTALREASAKLSQIPTEIYEQRLNKPPLVDIGEFRYIKAIDQAMAYREQQVREFQLDQIKSSKYSLENEAKARATAIERLENMATLDGSTMLVSNMRGEAQSIVAAHIQAQHAHRFQVEQQQLCAALVSHADRPRGSTDLLERLFACSMLAKGLVDEALSKFNQHDGRNHKGKALDHIGFEQMLSEQAPVVLRDGHRHIVLLSDQMDELQEFCELFDITQTTLTGLPPQTSNTSTGRRSH